MEVVGAECGITLGALSPPVIISLSDAFEAEHVMALVQNGVLLAHFTAGTSHGLLKHD